MKLRNKKTGEILETVRSAMVNKDKFRIYDEDTDKYYSYNSLAELNSEWEDAPKEHWFISEFGNVYSLEHIPMDKERTELVKAIGNYFKTKEEAEQAVERLKAWKRLKDNGAKITDYDCYGGTDTKGKFSGEVVVTIDVPQEIDKYLFDLLFGGEEQCKN